MPRIRSTEVLRQFFKKRLTPEFIETPFERGDVEQPLGTPLGFYMSLEARFSKLGRRWKIKNRDSAAAAAGL